MVDPATGEPYGYPTWFDFGSKAMYVEFMTRASVYQASIIPIVFFQWNKIAYRESSGEAEATGLDALASTDHMDAKLEALKTASVEQLSVWGSTVLLILIARMGLGSKFAARWIEHFFSNMAPFAFLYVVYLMFKAEFAWSVQILHFLGFVLTWLSISSYLGMATINDFDRDYKYLDAKLRPSIFYLLRIAKHKEFYGFQLNQAEESATEEEASLDSFFSKFTI